MMKLYNKLGVDSFNRTNRIGSYTLYDVMAQHLDLRRKLKA